MASDPLASRWSFHAMGSSGYGAAFLWLAAETDDDLLQIRAPSISRRPDAAPETLDPSHDF